MTHEKVPSVKRGELRQTNRMGEETIEKIIQAAKELLIEDGPIRFTLDRVAKKADIKKGTLLYHFPTKDALCLVLMRRYVRHLDRHFRAGVQEAQNFNSQDPNVTAFIEWYRAFHEEKPTYTSLGLHLLALAANNDTMRRPLENWYQDRFQELRNSPIGSQDAIQIVLALEGLFFLRHFHIHALSNEEISRLLTRLTVRAEK